MSSFDPNPPLPPEPPVPPPPQPEPPQPETPQPFITENMVQSLKQTRPWVLFLAILGFIGTGLCFLAGLFMLLGSGFAKYAQPAGPFSGAAIMSLMGALYIVIGVFYMIPCVLLIRYSGGIRRMATSDLVGGMETALKRQKTFWKYIGIFTLSVLILYVLAIIGFILFFVFRVMKSGGTMLSS